MAQYTSLDDADLQSIAARFGLGSVHACAPLWAGTINSNFRLETERGRVFLRVNEGKSRDDVAYEAELVTFLAARGVPTPCPLVAIDGLPYADLGGRLLTLFPWVTGHHPEPPSTGEARAAGQALARLHLAGDGFPRRRESRYALPRLLERARGIPDDVPAIDELRRELDAHAATPPSLPRGIIHGDLFPDNVLAGGPEGLILLDFEQASDGVLTYDLAVCLLAWCWQGGELEPGLAGAMVAGYRSVRALTAAEEDGLLPQARLAAARFAVTRITDVELNPRASAELKQTKDYRAYHARLVHLRQLRRLV